MPDISQSSWSETDASNNAAPPNGWPEGQAPSSVNDCARMMMGAMKRFWDRINGTVVSAGSANAQTLSYAIAPTALVNGETYSFKAGFANTSACTLQINALTAKTIKKRIAGTGQMDLAANDIIVGQRVVVVYDAATDVFEMASPVANVATGSVTSVASGAGLAGGPITGSGTLSVVETVNAQTGTSYTVAAGDQAKLVTFSNAAAIAVTLPQATGSFGAGWFADCVCLPTSTGAATITPTTSTIDGKASAVLTPGQSMRVISDGANYVTVRGQSSRNVVIVQDRKASGTAGSAITVNTYTDRDLNTKILDTGGIATVSSPNVTLPAGIYELKAELVVFGNNTSNYKSRLFNTTDGVVQQDTGGNNIVSLDTATPLNTQSAQAIRARFALSGTKNLKFQTWTNSGAGQAGAAVNGTGNTEPEIYLSAEFIQIA